MANVHIFSDPNGHFTKMTIERVCKIDPKNNIFINLSQPQNKSDQEISMKSGEVVAYIRSLVDLDRVFFHAYATEQQDILQRLRVNKDVKFIWIFWSAEFYNLPENRPIIYEEFERRFVKGSKVRRILRRFALPVLTGLAILKESPAVYSQKRLYKSYSKISFVCSLLKEDFNNIVSKSGATNLKHLPWAYISLKEILAHIPLNASVKSNAIMIGHSADPAGNQYSVMKKIFALNIENKIIFPLAYPNKKYAFALENEIKNLNRKNVEIWKNYVDPETYFNNLLQVGFAVFNHKVQQGLSNIIVLLWLGAKVYLNEANPIFIEFKRLGLKVFPMTDAFNPDAFLSFLDEETVLHNREILEKYFSEDVVDGYIYDALNC